MLVRGEWSVISFVLDGFINLPADVYQRLRGSSSHSVDEFGKYEFKVC